MVNGLEKKLPKSTPSKVDVGIPVMGYLLGSTWYPIEGRLRWMPKVATIRIAASKTPNQKLVLTGYCPEEQIRLGPLKVHISIDGKELSGEEFFKPEMPFARIVDVPPAPTGKPEMEIRIELDRTFQRSPGDRPLGLAFGTFEVR